MIDVNLLPDSKLKRLESRRTSQLIVSISTLVIIASIGLPVALFVSDLLLQQLIATKQQSIDSLRNKFEKKQDVQQILTVQSQLSSLSEVEENRFFSSNLLQIVEFTLPENVSISSLIVNNEDKTFEIQANATTAAEANRFIDTLDAIAVLGADGDSETAVSPFSDPLVESFSDDSDEPVTFSIAGTFNPEIGEIKNIKDFILQPYKLELIDQKNKSFSRAADNEVSAP